MANPALNSSVSGTVGSTVGGAVGSTHTNQMVAGQAQVRLDGGTLGGQPRSNSRSSSTAGMDDSMPHGWLMALVTVLLIGHQLRRKHRFLRPQRFSDF
jgi:hypothetical protein